jgi:putative phosphoribosyl transferase
MRYRDREDAGRQLATQLASYADRDDVVVLALPRGGVPVAFEIARRLRAPLDVFLVRKLGVPCHPELAMGAIASGGVRVLSHDLIGQLVVTPEEVEAVTEREGVELDRRDRMYRGDRPATPLAGRTVILVDDGLATGATMRVAVRAVVGGGASPVVVAVPVAPPSACTGLRALADEVVCLHTPSSFLAVGAWYDDFSETSDDEVRDLLGG